jgi:hypothetical protein
MTVTADILNSKSHRHNNLIHASWYHHQTGIAAHRCPFDHGGVARNRSGGKQE